MLPECMYQKILANEDVKKNPDTYKKLMDCFSVDSIERAIETKYDPDIVLHWTMNNYIYCDLFYHQGMSEMAFSERITLNKYYARKVVANEIW